VIDAFDVPGADVDQLYTRPAGRHVARHAARSGGRFRWSSVAARGALRVPEITVYFWVIKALSTAMGESTSDFAVHAIAPVAAVGLGFIGFVAALTLQLAMRRYVAWAYWLAVMMVGVFGTMAADVLHVGFGVPYILSSALYALVLAAVFWTWNRTERTLSIHTIDTSRRESFNWAAVVATFAMGTAVGDLTAVTLHLGYLLSAVLFACMIAVPAIGYRWLGWNSILSFWCTCSPGRSAPPSPTGSASRGAWAALAGTAGRLPWP
jgi:uncharacterized membrane-anchored protein